MRLSHRGGRTVHLSCGTNLPPAGNLDDVVAHLDAYATRTRDRLGVDTLGVSPWLPPALAAALAVDARGRARLRAELTARGLEVVTLSGLAYGDGPDRRPEPDWSTVERLEYTLDLARILVDLLPDDAVRGSVTTIGIGQRDAWDTARERAGARVLGRLSGGLAEIAWQTGRAVRVGLRPAPGAVMDSVPEIAAALARVDSDRVGICLDLPALACAWQQPADVLTGLAAAGVSVIRVQIAAALEMADPTTGGDALGGFVDGTTGYQVTTPATGYVGDLAEALADRPAGPWRIRYPVPLHTAGPAPLATTAEVSATALRHLLGGDVPACEHLDVHTTPGDAPAAPDDVADSAYTAMTAATDALVGCGLTVAGACAAR